MLHRLETKIWNRTNIASSKQAIKAALDLDFPVSGAPEVLDKRLVKVLGAIEQLEAVARGQGALDRYIYCMTALVHHEKYGGLTAGQIRSVFAIASAILRMLKLDALSSRIGFVYAELYLVMSQLHRRDGGQWQAAWDQQMSNIFSGRELSPEMVANQTLATAIRLLRLGHGEAALVLYIKAEGLATDFKQLGRCRLGLAQLFRLQGRFVQAQAAIAAARTTCDPVAREKQNLDWEELLLQVHEGGSPVALFQAIQPRGSHYSPTYFVEGFLYKTALNSNLGGKLPALASVARPRSLHASKLGLFFRCALAIEEFGDTAIPLASRLENLGHVLEKRDQLISVDKEVLVLAAAGRVLSLKGYDGLASIVWLEYQRLSLSLSGGRTGDSLSVGLPPQLNDLTNQFPRKLGMADKAS